MQRIAMAVAIVAATTGSTSARAQSITVTGSWPVEVDASDLVAGAGSDLAAAHTSPADQVTLDVYGVGPWTVQVRRVDSGWHGDLTVWVRRTSDGSGEPVSGGTAWQELSATWTDLFTGGAGWTTGITAQLQVLGPTLSTPPDAYATTLEYRIL
jgi:hypothetical protein